MSKHVLLLGATGTIGRATAKALRADGHTVTCAVRDGANTDGLDGCRVQRGSLEIAPGFDAVVSCIASRSGTPNDAWAVDHRVQSAALERAIAAGVPQFVLLSAICVQKPLLEFQKAKLAFESELQASGLMWSIVRPTAFFKSLSGQFVRVKSGKPFLVFGDGMLTACKPISDSDVGQYLSRCLSDETLQNKVLPIGGPGPAITPLEQGQLLFDALGIAPKFKHVPVAMMTGIIGLLGTLGKVFPSFADKAAFARIGRYYGTESMLVWDGSRYDADATPEFGKDTLADHYAELAAGVAVDDRGEHALF